MANISGCCIVIINSSHKQRAISFCSIKSVLLLGKAEKKTHVRRWGRGRLVVLDGGARMGCSPAQRKVEESAVVGSV
ncbi:hypothetical protein AAFF_G00000180 [Aldrovandia affinis]|uniref:Uncharacterized protein n=1 Tax=Aldrovandia affinis TaxID=143900 RepID=A0AAD7TCM1_9TELE|nr:hypothetical protein AAFF_G00000180 [Aldrovandia affinis]